MSRPSLEHQLQQIASVQAHLPAGAAVLTGLAAAAAVTVPWLWPLVRHISLIAHESAHAMIGSGLGHKVGQVRLMRSGDGATVIPAVRTRSADAAVGFIGYLGPSVFGLGAAALIWLGHIVAVPWLALATGAALLPLLRGWFSFASVIATGAAIFLVLRYAPAGAQAVLSYGIAWLLLLAGVRVVLQRGSRTSDAERLHQLTGVPRGLWSATWLAGSLAALAAGGRLLI
jgi:hypothetical protein